MAVMPMFPLGMVLLPGGILPLHVFEPRYRQLVIDCLQEDGEPEFGQALITHGWEAGGGDERSMVGTVAQMIQIEALDESRYSLVTIGTRRIRINAWLPDDPYPLADVDDWPDVDPDAAGLDVAVAATHARVRAALALAAELGDVPTRSHGIGDLRRPAGGDVPSGVAGADRPGRSLSAAGRHRARRQRLDVLDEVLDDVEAMLKFRLT